MATRLYSYDPAADAYVDLTMASLSPWTGVWVPVMAEVRALRSALLYPDPFCS